VEEEAKSSNLGKRTVLSGEKLKIYSDQVELSEIVDKIRGLSRHELRNELSAHPQAISWTALSEKIKNRSADDLRQHWRDCVLPQLVPSSLSGSYWTDKEDLDLLECVKEMELKGS